MPPASDSDFNTFPFPAIPHKPTHYISQNVPDPQFVNRPSISHNPGPTFGYHVSSHNHLESSQLSSSSSSRHVAINSNSQRLTTSTPVFNNISDLAAHYGIPQFLPSAPRTTPRSSEPGEPSSSTLSVESFTLPTSPDFADLCSNYLNMLSQKPDNDASGVHDTAPSTASPSDAEAIQTLMGVFGATPELMMSNDLNEYLTSPLIDSPLDDELLTTPAFGSADIGADILTSPLLDDFGGDSFGELPSLFDDFGSIYPPSKIAESYHNPPPNFDELYRISPDTPMLDTPIESPLDSPANRLPLRRPSATGTRKNITPESLVPVDAPTQQRKYLTPSATSRKEVPAVFARKRARTAAFGDEQDELNEDVLITPSMTEQEQIEAKRRQNTIAARRSRKRKLEYQRELEESVEQYKRESEIWKARAMTCQALLRSHNIECPEFPDP